MIRYFKRSVQLCLFQTLLLILSSGLPGFTQPPDDPIDPIAYAAMIGTGFDVGWAQFPGVMNNYTEQVVIDYASEGFTNARIRTHFDLSPELLVHLDSVVTHCLRHGVLPIVAYESEEAEEDPTRTNLEKVVKWWGDFAFYFRNHSHKLAFNLFIEVTHILGDLPPDTLNLWYQHIIPAIRESNPDRILILPPRGAYPEGLGSLVVPPETGYYYMAEWHDYAGGPTKLLSPDKLHKRWTTGTEIERDQIGISIETALEWTVQTGKPTWMGAWMAGKLNEPDYYTPEEECIFATHMVKEFARYQMPWSTNAHQHFYDVSTLEWLPGRQLLLEALKGKYLEEANRMFLYTGLDYNGRMKPVEIGFYDYDFLERYDLADQIRSAKIPWGFVLETFSDPGFTGNKQVITGDQSSLDGIPIASFKFRDIAFTDYVLGTGNPSNVTQGYAYPNPFCGQFRLMLEPGEEVSVRIYDLRGRCLFMTSGLNGTDVLAPGLEEGMYLLKVTSPTEEWTQSIICT